MEDSNAESPLVQLENHLLAQNSELQQGRTKGSEKPKSDKTKTPKGQVPKNSDKVQKGVKTGLKAKEKDSPISERDNEKETSNLEKSVLIMSDAINKSMNSGFENVARAMAVELRKGFEELNQNHSENMMADETEQDENLDPYEVMEVEYEDQEHESNFEGNSTSDKSSAKDSATGSFFQKRQKEKDEKSEKAGAPVSEATAIFVNQCFEGSLISKEEYEKRIDLLQRPENIEWLQTPRIEKSIWQAVHQDVRNRDLSLQKGQKALNLALTGVVHASELLEEGDVPNALLCLSKILEVGAYSHIKILSEERKAKVRENLPGDFKQLAAISNEVRPNELLGDVSENEKTISNTIKFKRELSKAKKEAAMARKLQSLRGAPHRGGGHRGGTSHRGGSSHRGGTSHRGSGSFRGGRTGAAPKNYRGSAHRGRGK